MGDESPITLYPETMFSVASYLDRIAYSGSTGPTAENLRALHRAHLLAVPFENLDISLGRKIVANESAILAKVIDLRRGGFCYELNRAFAALLQALGFQVTLLSARVARESGGEGPEFDHLSLRLVSGTTPARTGHRTGRCGRQISAHGRWEPMVHAEERAGRKLEAAVLFFASAAPLRGIRGHVPLSSDLE
jgi:arylamine N-acetyltransferase